MGTLRSAGRRGRAARAVWLGAGLAALAALLLASGAPARPEVSLAPLDLEALDFALVQRPGPALRAARDSLDAGEVERAERLLRAVAERHAIVADYGDLLRLELYGATERHDDAVALASAWAHADSPLHADVQRQLGRIRADRGEEEAARAAWETALAATDDSARRAELRTEIARSHLRSQQTELAAAQLLEVWARHPTSAEADEAEHTLEELEVQLGSTLRTAERRRRRADALFRARHNEAALAAYESALALGALQPRSAERARRQRAYTLFRLRRYSQAAEAFAELEPDAETRIAHARSVARAGDVPAAAKELERIAKQERGHHAARARLLAALLWEGEDEPDRARALFEELTRTARGTGYANAALWRLGWEAYRAQRYEAAVPHFEALGRAEGDPIAALQARYWALRAQERSGRANASAGFAALAAEYPLSYYGWRAGQRATPAAGSEPPAAPARGKAVLSPRELARPRILLEAGLVEFAREELDRLFVRARGLDDRLALAELYADAGEYHRPQRLMVDAYQERLARGPAPGPVELWWHAWPAPFREAVASATKGRNGLAPELVYAVMREESGYRPQVLSVSGAVGLLQLMPDTAQRVAARESLAGFSVDDLVLPSVNIRLGAAYLDELLLRFSGNATAAIGSYNAGPHRVVKWLAGAPLEDDEWVEAIPFQETRGYVKRVLRSVHAYRVLY